MQLFASAPEVRQVHGPEEAPNVANGEAQMESNGEAHEVRRHPAGQEGRQVCRETLPVLLEAHLGAARTGKQRKGAAS